MSVTIYYSLEVLFSSFTLFPPPFEPKNTLIPFCKRFHKRLGSLLNKIFPADKGTISEKD